MAVRSNRGHRVISEVLGYLKHGMKIGQRFKNDPNTEYFEVVSTVLCALSFQREVGPVVLQWDLRCSGHLSLSWLCCYSAQRHWRRQNM